MPGGRLFHYTDDEGYQAISSQRVWVFEASQPSGDHPFGAYFTTLGPGTRNLAKRLRIAKRKLEFVFCFTDQSDLRPLRGARGEFIFHSRADYAVTKDRQVCHGPRDAVAERLR